MKFTFLIEFDHCILFNYKFHVVTLLVRTLLDVFYVFRLQDIRRRDVEEKLKEVDSGNAPEYLKSLADLEKNMKTDMQTIGTL